MTEGDASPQHALLDRLHLLQHHVKGRLHAAVRDDGSGLAPAEARALAWFVHHPGGTQRELALHSGRDKAQIARIVKGLLARGLLQAQADAGDGRVVHLTATADGRRMQRRLHQHRVRIEAELLAVLTPAESAQLLAALDRLLDGAGVARR